MSARPEYAPGFDGFDGVDEPTGPHYRLVLPAPANLPARRTNGHGHAIAKRSAPSLVRGEGQASVTWVEPSVRVAPREPVPMPRHSLAATFEALAASGSRTLIAASPMRRAGTSSFIATAGRAIAESGLGSVVLVDAHARHPELHRRFGVSSERGLTEALDELYGFDITGEDGSQFGVGDWLEVLRAQGRTGQLTVCGEGRTYAIAIVRGRACAISSADSPPAWRLGERLVQRGRISHEQRDTALRIHEETGHPLGEVLTALGFVDPQDLAEALQQQCVRGLVDLIAMHSPDCRFDERAESHACAIGAGRFAPPAERGLERILRGQVLEYLKQPFLRSQTPSFLRDTGHPCLKVLVAGRRPCDLSEPARLVAFGLLIERLSHAFDFVLVDAPAAAAGGDRAVTLSMASRADGVLLVVPSRLAGTEATKRAVDDFRRAGARVLGVVMSGGRAEDRP